MKKKLLSILVISALFLSVLIVDNTMVQTNKLQADRFVLANNYEQLKQESDLIVQAKVLKGKDNKLDYDSDGSVLFGYTLTHLQIEEVYKGDVSVDEVIDITEEYYITTRGIGKTIWTQGQYAPANENHEYIFFLKKYGDDTRYKDMFFPIDLENGKYVVNREIANTNNIDNLSNDEMEILNGNNITYRDWYKSVAKEYIITGSVE